AGDRLRAGLAGQCRRALGIEVVDRHQAGLRIGGYEPGPNVPDTATSDQRDAQHCSSSHAPLLRRTPSCGEPGAPAFPVVAPAVSLRRPRGWSKPAPPAATSGRGPAARAAPALAAFLVAPAQR